MQKNTTLPNAQLSPAFSVLSNQRDENNEVSESNCKTITLDVELGSNGNVWHLGGGIAINQIE